METLVIFLSFVDILIMLDQIFLTIWLVAWLGWEGGGFTQNLFFPSNQIVIVYIYLDPWNRSLSSSSFKIIHAVSAFSSYGFEIIIVVFVAELLNRIPCMVSGQTNETEE